MSSADFKNALLLQLQKHKMLDASRLSRVADSELELLLSMGLKDSGLPPMDEDTAEELALWLRAERDHAKLIVEAS
jgi:hypothetical protein